MKTAAERHVARAEAAAALGRHGAVERECRAALAQDPRAVAALELLAWSLMEQRRNDEALAAADAGLRLDAERAHLHYVAAVVLHRARRLPAARARAETAVSLAPRSGLYRVRLARVASEQGDVARAVDEARGALALAPRSGFVLGEVAVVLCEAGRVEEGCEVAARRLALEPDDTWALAGHARALAAAGSHAALVEVARRVIAREPNLGWLWGMYAAALDELGRVGEADAAMREGLRLTPGTAEGGVALARALCERREWARARAVARAVLARAPRHARAAAVYERAQRGG